MAGGMRWASSHRFLQLGIRLVPGRHRPAVSSAILRLPRREADMYHCCVPDTSYSSRNAVSCSAGPPTGHGSVSTGSA
jgi:hypothetical protein